MTANFKDSSIENMDTLLALQPNRPILVSEYWTGWFDHWFEPGHNSMNVSKFDEILTNIFNYQGSVNFYMFHGGTNFGFLNGANFLSGIWPYYVPTVTSYDYDAPLSEAGGYTEKYTRAAEMIAAQDPLSSILIKPDMPAEVSPIAIPEVTMTEWIDFRGLVDKIPSSHIVNSDRPLSMERLPINSMNGQSYGYVNYRVESVALNDGDVIQIRGHVYDTVQVMVNGVMINNPILTDLDLTDEFGSWTQKDAELIVDLSNTGGCSPSCTLDFFVENLGRSNFGKYHEFQWGAMKGMWEGDVLLNGTPLKEWLIYAMEFKNDWVANSLDNWEPYDAVTANSNGFSPRAVRGTVTLTADQAGRDTYFNYEETDWVHGAVFVNGFNIGRYHEVGPSQVLYVPGPLLVEGENEIIVFDNFQSAATASFTETPNYGVPLYLPQRIQKRSRKNMIP